MSMKKVLIAIKHNPETFFVVGFFTVVVFGAIVTDYFFGNI